MKEFLWTPHQTYNGELQVCLRKANEQVYVYVQLYNYVRADIYVQLYNCMYDSEQVCTFNVTSASMKIWLNCNLCS